MTGESLPKATESLGRIARDARAWVHQVKEVASSVDNEADALLTTTRRAEVLSRKLTGTAAKRPCVGVFGPSQAGKSYLVSALARGAAGTLACNFAGTQKDFLREINPPGDRESTGLVTRFTTMPSTLATPEFPVEVRLLSETDLVKILANAYFSDFDANNLKVVPPNEAAVREILVQARAGASAQSVASHLDEINLFDLSEYFERYFSARIENLRQAGYWGGLIDLAGRLPLDGRASLYAPLWGGLPEITQLFVQLARGLETLGHAAVARVVLAALVPRDRSIIDVVTLRRLGTAEDASDGIAVQPILGTAATATVTVPRALLTALVAELSLTMTETPWPLLSNADLLDFPGARSREKMIDIAIDPAERSHQLLGLLLRGKVAFLFQRFTEERELTAMLLCMPNNPAEVKDLAAMVRGWIGLTHGDTPAERAKVHNALFLILTKFDLEFIEKGGETTETRKGKWDRRLHASFLELYQRDGWPQNWDGLPFNNCIFLRNPGMKQEHLMAYSEIRRLPDGSDLLIEAGASTDPGKQALIAEYRDAFLSSTVCAPHFADRAAIWEAALKPNDGGISFLVDRLTQVLSGDFKARQISEQLTRQASGLKSQFERFYRSNDDSERARRDEVFKNIRRDFFLAVKDTEYRPFIRLLAAMTLEDREVRESFLTVAALKSDFIDAAVPAETLVPAADPWGGDPWADSPAASAPSPVPPAPAVLDRPTQFARVLMNRWAEKLRALTRETGFGLSGVKLDEVMSEVIIGANRLKLGEQIADQIRTQISAANVRWDDAADRAVSLAGPVLNNFIADLGFRAVPADRRPRAPRSDQPIFALPPVFDDLPILDDKRRDLEREVFIDWATALHQLALDNVNFSGGNEIDEVHNAQLGRLLTDLTLIVSRA